MDSLEHLSAWNRALVAASIDETETNEERAAVEEVREGLSRGQRLIPHEEILRECGR